MKKGMLFCLSHREKRVKKINLLHFPYFKKICDFKIAETSTDYSTAKNLISMSPHYEKSRHIVHEVVTTGCIKMLSCSA